MKEREKTSQPVDEKFETKKKQDAQLMEGRSSIRYVPTVVVWPRKERRRGEGVR